MKYELDEVNWNVNSPMIGERFVVVTPYQGDDDEPTIGINLGVYESGEDPELSISLDLHELERAIKLVKEDIDANRG